MVELRTEDLVKENTERRMLNDGETT